MFVQTSPTESQGSLSGDEHHATARKGQVSSGSLIRGRVFERKLSTCPKHTSDIRDITGTAVNIAAQSKGDLVKENLVLYRLDEKYIVGHGWRLYVTYHPLGLAASEES